MSKIKMMDMPLIGSRIIQRKIVRKEGGQQRSKTLREYVEKKYKVKIGMHTYGSCFVSGFNTGGTVEIGRYCSFGPDVHYFGANHPMSAASMSPYFYQKSWGGDKVKDIERFKLTVGNDCWIGYGTIITAGCRSIGNGAVIGAGSVVTHDVAPYTVVAGNPARVIRKRFDDETIELLEKSQWFLLEPEKLLEYYDYLYDPRRFAEAVIDGKN